MGTEIERKFLVTSDAWRVRARSVSCVQGYLNSTPPLSVRARIIGDHAYLTIKKSIGPVTNIEFEYPIPETDARQMLAQLCDGYPIEKTRHYVELNGMMWEIDEFHGVNDGLIVAELELTSENQSFSKPDWLGEEVSNDRRYKNSNLSQHPYSTWGKVNT